MKEEGAFQRFDNVSGLSHRHRLHSFPELVGR